MSIPQPPAPDNTGIAPNQVIQSVNELNERARYSTKINEIIDVVNTIEAGFLSVQTGNYIRPFNQGAFTFGTNSIQIANNAVTAWDNQAGIEVTGWPVKTFNTTTNPVEMANNFAGYLWIVWDGINLKDYEISGRERPPQPNRALLGFYTISNVGVVTFTYLLERFYERSPYFNSNPQFFNGGVFGTNKYPRDYYNTSGIAFTSASALDIKWFHAKDTTNATDIDINAPVSISLATVGMNGILQSANLTGTVTVTTGSAAITFSASQTGVLQVGDVITTFGNQARRLISGSGVSWTADSVFATTETAVTFKRGGRAANTNYFIYASKNANLASYFLTTRNLRRGDSLVDTLDYTHFRQITNNNNQPVILLLDAAANLTTNIQPGFAGERVKPQAVYLNANQILIKRGASVASVSGNDVITLASDLILDLTVSGAFGLDTGSRAANTWYQVYLLKNPTTQEVTGVFSTVNEAATGSITAPSGFTEKRQLKISVRNNASNVIIPFIHYPQLDRVVYRDSDTQAGSASQTVGASTPTAWTTYNQAILIPPVSRLGLFSVLHTGDSLTITRLLYTRESGVTGNPSIVSYTSSAFQSNQVDGLLLRVNSAQALDMLCSNINQAFTMWAQGFIVTEVN